MSVDYIETIKDKRAWNNISEALEEKNITQLSTQTAIPS